jgi:hypothetical protein
MTARTEPGPAVLELRYRRLLGVYPAGHREFYGPEMLAVLMAGARPGQRFPAPAEIVDLLRGGLAARLRRAARPSTAWRDAAGIAGLLGAVVLMAVAGRRLLFGLEYAQASGDPMSAFGVRGGLLLDVALRTVAWLAVVVAALCAARRTAAVLGLVAAVVELGAIVAWMPRDWCRPFHMSWSPVLTALVVACLLVTARARITGLSRGSVLRLAGVLALAAVARRPSDDGLRWWLSTGANGTDRSLVAVAAVLGAAALVVTGLRPVPAEVRRRLLVLIAPVAVVPVAQRLMAGQTGLAWAYHPTPVMIAAQSVVMIGAPLAVLALGLTLLRLRERETDHGAGEPA